LRLQPNPFYRRVGRALRLRRSLPAVWEGIVFRSVLLQFAKPEQIVDGIGASKSGGRWNRPGIRVLYCSLTPGGAAEESMRLFEAIGIQRQVVKPRVIVGIRYRLQAVIELKDLLRSIPGTTLNNLLQEDWQKVNSRGRETAGQAVGRALFNAKAEGLLAPSARVEGAINLVLFPENLQPGSRQAVLEQKEFRAWLK
jgi:RES domain-containing protein